MVNAPQVAERLVLCYDRYKGSPMGDLRQLLGDGTALVMTFGYAGIFVAMLIEGSGIPLPFPGASLLAFVGYGVWTGALGLVEASIASAAGSRDAGPQLLPAHGRRLALTQEKLARAESWFRTHAGRATFFARLTPGVRIYISIAAGLARMCQAVFLVSTFLGTWLWAMAFIMLGWALGRGWEKVTDILSAVQATLVLAVVVLIVAAILVNRRTNERNVNS